MKSGALIPSSCSRRLSALVALGSLGVLSGCGPSPAMEPRSPARLHAQGAHVVVACDDDDDVDDEVQPPPRAAKGVEYVRIDQWEPPPSVKDIEARIEPRGDKPPDYVSLPRLTMHREIAPFTSYRRGTYWH